MESREPGGNDGWSVVMTRPRTCKPDGEQTEDRWGKFVRSAPDVFGFDLFDLHLLATGPADDLPAELKDGLTRAEAEQLVVKLFAVDIEAEAVRTDEVQGVRYRVRDLLPDYYDDDWTLSAVEGLVICSSPIAGRQQVKKWRQQRREDPVWYLEDYVNHVHTDGDTFDELLDDSVARAERLIEALRSTYPDRAFTIARDSCRVSFWQTTPETPRTDAEWSGIPEKEGVPQEVFCYDCQKKRPFHPIPDMDPKWPRTQWGRCNECGQRVPVRECAQFIFIGPGADQLTADG